MRGYLYTLAVLAFMVLGIASSYAVAQAAPSDNGAFSGPMGDRNSHALYVDLQPWTNAAPATEEQLAQKICAVLENGASEGEVIYNLEQPGSANDPWPAAKATFVTHASEWHYCPDQY